MVCAGEGWQPDAYVLQSFDAMGDEPAVASVGKSTKSIEVGYRVQGAQFRLPDQNLTCNAVSNWQANALNMCVLYPSAFAEDMQMVWPIV